jgi:hypothetical protein
MTHDTVDLWLDESLLSGPAFWPVMRSALLWIEAECRQSHGVALERLWEPLGIVRALIEAHRDATEGTTS